MMSSDQSKNGYAAATINLVLHGNPMVRIKSIYIDNNSYVLFTLQIEEELFMYYTFNVIDFPM